MNPGTDHGKKELNFGIRSRFSEVYVQHVEDSQYLSFIVKCFLNSISPHPPVEEIVKFYLEARHLAKISLLDGENQRPDYFLRSFVQALIFSFNQLYSERR